MQYIINLAIDDTGLANIYAADQYVTIVNSVVSDPLPNLPVAWLAFQPLESNQITWNAEYGVYASTTALQAGATIDMTSSNPDAQEGYTYVFAQGQFTGQSGTGDTYNITNDQANGFSFGLTQSATVNNITTTSPLSAVPVLLDEGASFTPEQTISIFLSSYSNNGSVISQVASNALTFTLTSQTPVANLGFDDATNSFVLQSITAGAALSAGKFARSLRRVA